MNISKLWKLLSSSFYLEVYKTVKQEFSSDASIFKQLGALNLLKHSLFIDGYVKEVCDNTPNILFIQTA